MITVVGSLNYDLFIETERFPRPGEAVLGRKFRRSPGGKGANQAFAFARLGNSANLVGAVGCDPFGDEMVEGLRGAGVGINGVLRKAAVASGTAMIVLDATGQNQIVVANGANDTLTPEDIDDQAAPIRGSQAVVCNLEVPVAAVERAFSIARTAKVLTVLNPAPYRPCESVLNLCDWVFPNEVECEQLTGIKPISDSDARRAAARLRFMAPEAQVALTLGARGAWLDTGAFVGLIAGFSVAVVDTVGAGDTWTAAFVTRLIEGVGPKGAARFANAAAAIAVTREGAQSSIPTREEVEQFLADGG